MNQSVQITWKPVCPVDEIIPETGVGALLNDQQVAVFRTREDKLYALDNHCPFSDANVIARGILGSLDDQRVVASPIYKQHFVLESGECLEDETVQLKSYQVRNKDGMVEIAVS